MEEIKDTQCIVVNDGSVRVPIRNTYGDEIGVFRFRPADVGILKRFDKVSSEFAKVTEPLKQLEDEENTQKAFNEAEARLYKLVDYLFDGNTSEAFFGKINPFSLVGGKFYCEIVLDVVGDYISNYFSEETKKALKRVRKYTMDYEK